MGARCHGHGLCGREKHLVSVAVEVVLGGGRFGVVGCERRVAQLGEERRALGLQRLRVDDLERLDEHPRMVGEHAAGITWEKFTEHRGYAMPGYECKAPQPGDIVPDSKILSLEAGGADSTLLTEARKLAEEAGSDKVVLAFDAVTCPFFRLYAAQEFAAVAVKYKIPTLHVYLREAGN